MPWLDGRILTCGDVSVKQDTVCPEHDPTSAAVAQQEPRNLTLAVDLCREGRNAVAGLRDLVELQRPDAVGDRGHAGVGREKLGEQ